MMSWWQVVRWDLMMQYRAGFWVAGGISILPWVGVFLTLSRERAMFFLPAILFLEVAVAGTLFMAGLFFFERREGSILAYAVTPMPTWQWLLSKLLGLTLLSSLLCFVLVGVAFGLQAPWGMAIPVILCVCALFAMFGFLLASPFRHFTSFFVFYALFFAFINLPVLALFNVTTPLFWLLPSQPALVLLRGTFSQLSTTSFLLTFGLLLAWMGVAFALCLRFFRHFIAGRKGG